MDIDLELILDCENAAISRLAQEIPDDLEVDRRHGCLVIRREFENMMRSVDEVIQEFLIRLHGVFKTFPKGNHRLRAGLFFTPDESVILPFQISSKTVKIIADIGASLEVSGYLCDE